MPPASPLSVSSAAAGRLAGPYILQARLSASHGASCTARFLAGAARLSNSAALQATNPPRRIRGVARTAAPCPASSFYPASTSLARRRCYHSFDHRNRPLPEDDFSPAEQAVLTAAARYIPEHGFSAHTIALGARDAGYPAISAAILPDGVFSLVLWHLVSQRTCLAARSQELYPPSSAGQGGDAAATSDGALPLDAAQIFARAESLTWERLLGNTEVIDRWQEALAIMAQPSYVPASMRQLARLSDEIWTLAGDTAVDPTWYTKRAALSAIYAASELFMTTDTGGPEYAATRAFLHRRFQESLELGGYVRSVSQWVGFAANAGINVLRSKGVGI